MATTNLKVRSGNRIVVQFDGVDIGLVQSVRASDDYSPEPASGIGDIHVQEHVPTVARHAISVSNMVLLKNKCRIAGIQAINGDDVLEGRVFDIVQYGKDEFDVLRKYSGCSYASGDVDVSAHRITVSNSQFMALDVTGTGL